MRLPLLASRADPIGDAPIACELSLRLRGESYVFPFLEMTYCKYRGGEEGEGREGRGERGGERGEGRGKREREGRRERREREERCDDSL